jgi:hypothetical protein
LALDTPVTGHDGPSSDSWTAGRSVSSELVFPVAPKRTRKIAILGFGETVKDCPWRDPSWELWAMNGFWRAAKPDYAVDVPEERYSLWFDMHSAEFTKAYGQTAGFGDAQHEWLKKPHPFTVLMLDDCPEYPSVQGFPVDAVAAALGRDYFTSTIAYALTFALMQPDIAEIGLWGIDLVHDTEYSDQRPCAEYWIGRAEALGIKVTVHEQSALLKQRHRYGYEVANPLVTELRAYCAIQLKAIPAAIEKHTAEMERLKLQMHTDDGARQAFASIVDRLNIWERGGKV